jgi:hypothetical protein
MPLALSTFLWIVVFVALSLLFVLWLYCLFNVVMRSDLGGGAKVVWALALIVLAPFAIAAYLVVGRSRS